MIKGIYADEADKLNPEQWVNVYHVDFMGITDSYLALLTL